MAKGQSPKKFIQGPSENEEGQVVAEDGREVTPALLAIYDHAAEKKQEKAMKVYRERAPQELVPVGDQRPAIVADTFAVPKICEHCYLQDKCPHFEDDATCYFRTKVTVNSAADMLALVKMLIEMQGERVIFGRFIEQTEGGYVDRNLSEEMRRLMELMEKFKELGSSPQEEITVKVKGTEAVKQAGGAGILSQIFGGGPAK